MKKYFFVPVLVLALSIFFGCKTDPGELIPTPAHPTFSVILDSNNGSNETQVQTGEYGSTITLNQNTFVYPGHTFIGWSTRDNPEIRSVVFYGDKDTFKIVGNQTLYARWKAHDCKIEFNFNDAGQNLGADMSEITFCSDGEITLPLSTYALQDMGFRGWTTDPKSKDVIYKNGETIPADTFAKSEEGMTTVQLYAVWEAPDYFVTFYANNGTGKSVKQGFFAGEEQNLLSCDFERTDYVLKGWSKTSYPNDDASVNYAPEEKITVTSDMALYAVWTKQMTKLKFVANGGEGSMSDESFFYSSGITIKTNAFTRDHYNFKGWNTKADGSGTPYAAGAKITLASIQDEVTLYAQWEILKFTITYVDQQPSDDGYCTGEATSSKIEVYGTTVTIGSSGYTMEHYDFKGWKYNGKVYAATDKITLTEETGNITLYGQWEPKTYTITMIDNRATYTNYDFVTKQANNTYTKTYKYGDPVSFESTDLPSTTFTADFYNYSNGSRGNKVSVTYKFYRWKKDSAITNSDFATDFTSCKEGNFTVYATWYLEKNVYVLYKNIPGASSSAKTIDVQVQTQAKPTYSTAGTNSMYKLIGFDKSSDGYAKYRIDKNRDLALSADYYGCAKTNASKYLEPVVLYGVWFKFDRGEKKIEGEENWWQYNKGKDSNQDALYAKFDDFYIDKYELTNLNYYKVMGGTVPSASEKNKPKIFETIPEAIVFIETLNKSFNYKYYTGGNNATAPKSSDYILYNDPDPSDVNLIGTLNSTKYLKCNKAVSGFRLPDPGEWIKALTNCGNLFPYPETTGDKIGDVAWYSVNSSSAIQSVGGKHPTAAGLYDALGNAEELVHEVVNRSTTPVVSGYTDSIGTGYFLRSFGGDYKTTEDNIKKNVKNASGTVRYNKIKSYNITLRLVFDE